MDALSVVVITFNEMANIRACLDSVHWCDDIVVVDSGSTDGTLDICREFTPCVFTRDWQGYAAQKNWGIAQARHPWILNLDADERVSPELQTEIRARVSDDLTDGYLIPFRNYLGGRWMRYGVLYPDWYLRLFRKDHCQFQGTARIYRWYATRRYSARGCRSLHLRPLERLSFQD
jgi:glycosyltransferase involved in cell wall biosynthesis